MPIAQKHDAPLAVLRQDGCCEPQSGSEVGIICIGGGLKLGEVNLCPDRLLDQRITSYGYNAYLVIRSLMLDSVIDPFFYKSLLCRCAGRDITDKNNCLPRDG